MNSSPTQAEPEAPDWRTLFPADHRQSLVDQIMDALKRHLPISGPEGLLELKKVAVRFEEKTYHAATSEADYQQKISLKLLTMERRSNTGVANPLQPNTVVGNQNPADQEMSDMKLVREPKKLAAAAARKAGKSRKTANPESSQPIEKQSLTLGSGIGQTGKTPEIVQEEHSVQTGSGQTTPLRSASIDLTQSSGDKRPLSEGAISSFAKRAKTDQVLTGLGQFANHPTTDLFAKEELDEVVDRMGNWLFEGGALLNAAGERWKLTCTAIDTFKKRAEDGEARAEEVGKTLAVALSDNEASQKKVADAEAEAAQLKLLVEEKNALAAGLEQERTDLLARVVELEQASADLAVLRKEAVIHYKQSDAFRQAVLKGAVPYLERGMLHVFRSLAAKGQLPDLQLCSDIFNEDPYEDKVLAGHSAVPFTPSDLPKIAVARKAENLPPWVPPTPIEGNLTELVGADQEEEEEAEEEALVM